MSQPHRRLLNYALLREIGRGGMATVWYAENSVGRAFAIKLLKPELVAEESSVAERFRNEAQIMVRLEHPAILRVEDFYEDGPTLAIIMEYLAGHDLNQHVHQHGAVSETQAIGWFAQILDAFAYVHQKGYFHRDVKPSNLFLTNAGAIKVMDFGIAKIVGTDLSLTQTDMLMGSPLYMSPEQIVSPKSIDFRTDIYSLGVTLHALLAGQKPYNDAEHSMFSIQTDIVQQPLARLAHVSETVNEAIQRATQKKAADRFADCTAFARALTAQPAPAPSDDETVLRPARPAPRPTLPATDDATVLKPGAAAPVPTLTSPAPSVPTPPVAAPVMAGTTTEKTARNRLPFILAAVAGLLVLGAGGWFFGFRQGDRPVSAASLTVNPAQQVKNTEPVPASATNKANGDLNRAIAFYGQQRYDSAFALLNRHRDSPALADNAEAATDLGIMYFYGPSVGVGQNLPVAKTWLQKGMDGGNAKAPYFLGLLSDGADFSTPAKSVARGHSQMAVDYYQTGANRNDAYAQATLGELFLLRNKYLENTDACTILTYLKKAADQNLMGAAPNYKALKKSGRCTQ